MKKYEVAALVLLVLFIISSFSTPLYTLLLSKVYGAKTMGALSLHQHAIISVQALLKLLVNFAIAEWLARQARKDGLSPSIWALFGLLFSVLGAVLYFMFREQRARSAGPAELGGVEKRGG
jgi:hypothetical protein